MPLVAVFRFSAFFNRTSRAPAVSAVFAFFLAFTPNSASAASVRGIVTDPSGARVTGATVALMYNGEVVANSISTADGSYQLTTGTAGRFFLVVSATNFRQLQTPDFYAGALDAVERKLILEPAWVRQSIVVTANGVPTPQPQTSFATTVLSPLDLARRTDFIDALRQVPGAFVVQAGQRGSQSSVFLRGGSSQDTMVLLDGTDATNLGGGFDFGPFSTAAFESSEIFRGPNTNLYGSGAASGVVSMTTAHGTTDFPSVLSETDGGNFYTYHQRLQVSGARDKIDYLGAYSWYQTSNDLPNDRYNVSTYAANLGWAPSSSTQLRAAGNYGLNSIGVPNAWDFYHVTDDATQKDQNLYLSGSIENQTTASFHNLLRYGLTRKREQENRWTQSGSGTFDMFGASYGYPVTITGANGYSAHGQALLDFSPTSSYQIVSNRDLFAYQGDFTFTPHLIGLMGFRYENERGANPGGFAPDANRNNYQILASVHGDFKSRLFYTLAGSVEHYSLFGLETSPRAGITFFAMRPRTGVFSGTRILFSYGEGVREPSLTDQFYSLYSFLEQNGGQNAIQQLHISQLAMPHNRTWEGGLEQSFLSQHIIFRANAFHNQFDRQIEYVGLNLIPQLLPGLTPAQQKALEAFLQSNGAYELSINSGAYRAMGIESSIESGIGRNIFLRGGYTYLDAVVQQSFSNDDTALLGPPPTYNGIPIGVYSPLQGARPFRRAPHTGFFSATYASRRITGMLTGAFASRSDDSTYLGDSAYGLNPNALLLPNRNLDYSYTDLGLGGSYQLLDWLTLQAQANNLLNTQHIAPIGFPSLPMNFRAGIRIDWGLRGGH
jgi:iron complex outermembrane receptor protein/vitamin B12 transporter